MTMQKLEEMTPVILRDYKPIEDIDLLIKALTPHATFVSARKGQRFNYLSSIRTQCYLITEGSVTIHRTLDGRVISTAFGPVILGTSNYIIDLNSTYIKVNQSMQLGIISTEELTRQLDISNLWRPFSQLLLFTISHFLHNNLSQVTPTSYERIRSHILVLNSETDEIKSKTNMTRYIQDRTLLSRSHIMMIIATLKKGGHIEVKRGVLLRVNSLPKKF